MIHIKIELTLERGRFRATSGKDPTEFVADGDSAAEALQKLGAIFDREIEDALLEETSGRAHD